MARRHDEPTARLLFYNHGASTTTPPPPRCKRTLFIKSRGGSYAQESAGAAPAGRCAGGAAVSGPGSDHGLSAAPGFIGWPAAPGARSRADLASYSRAFSRPGRLRGRCGWSARCRAARTERASTDGRLRPQRPAPARRTRHGAHAAGGLCRHFRVEARTVRASTRTGPGHPSTNGRHSCGSARGGPGPRPRPATARPTLSPAGPAARRLGGCS